MRRTSRMTWKRWILLAIVLALAGREAYLESLGPLSSSEVTVEKLFAEGQSGHMVEIQGEIRALLSDDRQGSRHQRFIVTLASGHTLLVAHNIDLAQRVPVGEGESIEVRGEYEWNVKGGVLHWTHHDPGNRREGGWIRHAGEVYR